MTLAMTLPRSAKHVYGHLKDPADYQRPAARPLFQATPYPTAASLSSFLPKTMNQGQTGRCVGFGKAGSIYTSGKGKIFLPSPSDIYTLARCVDRIPDGAGNLPPLADIGSRPSQADRAIAEWGVRPFDDAIDGPNISEEDLNGEPALADLKTDSATLLIGSYALDDAASDFIDQICHTIAAGYAVSFAIPDADDAFESYTGGVLGGPVGRIYGGHELFCYGYEFTPSGAFYIDGLNSWGEDWGVVGGFRGGRDFVKRWVDVQAMRVYQKAA
jgi:hypothetical protein